MFQCGNDVKRGVGAECLNALNCFLFPKRLCTEILVLFGNQSELLIHIILHMTFVSLSFKFALFRREDHSTPYSASCHDMVVVFTDVERGVNVE